MTILYRRYFLVNDAIDVAKLSIDCVWQAHLHAQQQFSKLSTVFHDIVNSGSRPTSTTSSSAQQQNNSATVNSLLLAWTFASCIVVIVPP